MYTKQVICINWGTKYGAPYVNRLYAMVARNITPPFTLTCFTDDDTGFRDEVLSLPLPPLDVELPTNTLGKWPKARLWSERLGDLSGPVLFLDLDVVVTGSLDEFFTYGDPDDVILAQNPTNPFERLGQTSVYRFPVGKLVALKELFMADPQGVADKYRFEQRFVTKNAPGGVKLWPRGWVPHFRRNCMRTFPLNYFVPPQLPRDARIVIFPGPLNPPEAIAGKFHVTDPVRSRAEHLLATFGSDKREPPLRHLRHFFHPTPWVKEHWTE